MNITNPLNKLALAVSTFASEVTTEVKTSLSKKTTIEVIFPLGIEGVSTEKTKCKIHILDNGNKTTLVTCGKNTIFDPLLIEVVLKKVQGLAI